MLSAAPIAAEIPFLALPLDCTLGQTCFIEDYVDARPGPGDTDYACGFKSRDGHKGTDFALLSFEAMQAGVHVLAAAPGVVEATRDGMEDTPVTPESLVQISGRECGNAVRIRHDNGYQTLYCHLMRGSVAVQRGDAVQAGDPLGLVGLSGQTNYPHVHITVLKDGATIDPFAPTAAPDTCGMSEQQLWLTPLEYDQTGLFTAGFSTAVPDLAQVQSGAARVREARTDQPLVVYGHAFKTRQGDVMHLQASGPQGEIFDHSVLIKSDDAQMFRAFGKRAPSGGWPSGDYRGYVRLMRGDTVLAIRHADIVVR